LEAFCVLQPWLFWSFFRAAVCELESRLETGSAEWADEQQEVAAQLAEKEDALAALEAQHKAHTDALVQDCARKVNRHPKALSIFLFRTLGGSCRRRKSIIAALKAQHKGHSDTLLHTGSKS
jgi:uncharacterized membrane protein YccC